MVGLGAVWVPRFKTGRIFKSEAGIAGGTRAGAGAGLGGAGIEFLNIQMGGAATNAQRGEESTQHF